MNTFLMFGKYSSESLHQMSPQRTDEAVELIDRFGGEVQSMYATLGLHDLVFVVSFPDIASAMRASVTLSKLTGIAFTTAPAMPVQDFDQLMQE